MSFVIITNKSFMIMRRIILEAEKYIRLVSFLFYDDKLCDLLIEKRKLSNIEMEILTTPPEAAESDESRESAAKIQKRLKDAGIKVIACDWEVGQPELTISTRAGGRVPRWFAMHAKCLATGNCALVTSADITRGFSLDSDWNTHVMYTDSERIDSLCQKYEKIRDIFSDVPAHICPEYVDLTVSPRKLIRGYPIAHISEPSVLKEGFFFLPHEGYGREIINKAIQDAEEFIYLVFETIYDDELEQFILKKLISNPRIDFRIVTSPLTTYVQNPAKTRATFVQLASYGAKIRTKRNLRAKMLVTDKVLISGSFDLVKMGIGTQRSIRKGVKALVASTEIVDINARKDYIKEAREQFEQAFNESNEEYGLWFSKDAERIMRSTGAKKIAKDAKEFLGYMIFNEGRKSSERIKRISLTAVEIARMRNKFLPHVRSGDIQKAEQILLLFDSKELTEKSLCAVLGLLDAREFLRILREIS